MTEPVKKSTIAAGEAPATSTPGFPVPADRISELYNGEIFTAETAEIARNRIHWMCSQCVGETVLDVGCSQGIASILLAREGFRVTGLDGHPETMDYARKASALEAAGVQARITWVEGDLADIPPSDQYDTIILGEVLEHQSVPGRFFAKAVRHLNTGGRIVLTTPFGIHPSPDHKSVLLPRHLVEIAMEQELHIEQMDIVDGYMRMTLVTASVDASQQPGDMRHLLLETEKGTLASQEVLYSRLQQRSEQLKKKTEASKMLEKRIAALEQKHVADLKELRVDLDESNLRRQDATEQAALLRELIELTQAELDNAREEVRREQAQRIAGEIELVKLREQLSYQQTLTEESLRARDRKIAGMGEALERSRSEAEASKAQLTEENATLAAKLAEVRRQLDDARAARPKPAAAQQPSKQPRKELTPFAEGEEIIRGNGQILSGAEIGELFALPSPAITWQTIDNSLRVTSTLAHGEHIYAYSKELFSLTELGFQKEMQFHLCSSTEIDVQVAVIFYDAHKERISHVIKEANINQIVVIPEDAVWIKLGLRFSEPGSVTIDEFIFGQMQLDLAEMFRTAGANPVIQEIIRRSGEDARMIARNLLKFGMMLAEEGQPEAEYPLALAATGYERSEPVLRGFFWAAQRAKEFEAACGAILELEHLAGPQPSPKQTETLQKLKISPAYLLSVLRLIEPKQPPRLASIPQRICYVLHNSLPYSSGGYGTRSHGVAGGLKEAGCDVVILTRPGFPLDVKPELNANEVPLIDDIDGIRYVRTLGPLRSGVSALEYMTEAADAIEARIREYRPELVISASNHLTALPALIAARRLGLPFIYEVRGLWEITRVSRDNDFAEKPAFAVQRILEASVAKHADYVFTLTEPLREELVERGVAPEKIDLLPNSCDPSRFLPRERDEELARRLGIPGGVPVIGYIGTFVVYEGLEDLAYACALLKAQGIEFRLLMVGNENASGQDRGPITEEIARIADEHAFSDWLIMPGRVPHEEVESYYSLIDIAPFPRKPWPVCEMVSPMKPLEALAMEKAVVVSSVRALVEMIEHEETGLVFDKGDIESLAATLRRLIDSPDLRQHLGIQGRKWVEQERTWRQIGVKAVNLIESLVLRETSLAVERAD